MSAHTHVVTSRAGTHVAGRRVVPGEKLTLTELEAQHEELQGAIVKIGAEIEPAFTQDSEDMDRLRDEAQAFKAREATPAVSVQLVGAPAVSSVVQRGSEPSSTAG